MTTTLVNLVVYGFALLMAQLLAFAALESWGRNHVTSYGCQMHGEMFRIDSHGIPMPMHSYRSWIICENKPNVQFWMGVLMMDYRWTSSPVADETTYIVQKRWNTLVTGSLGLLMFVCARLVLWFVHRI